MKQIVDKILEYKEGLEARETKAELKEVSRQEFTFLLGGIAAFRKVPGITEHMGFSKLYHCDTEENEALVKEHLKSLFDVVDKESLLKACYIQFDGSEQYEQFMTFWKGAPLFDPSELNPAGLKGFKMCMDIAANFYPFLQEKGFYAWDINERICMCRTAVAAGIITEEEFYEITDDWVKVAQVFYHSYEEYAISCLCGAMYQMAIMGEDELEAFLELSMNILNVLLYEDGPWQTSKWYVPKEREWVGLVQEIGGCLITKRALENNHIGYMYRDEPNPGYPDSGWRFIHGDEDQEYMGNSDNITIVTMNTICNLHPSVLAYIHAKVGVKYGINKDGSWTQLAK